MDAQGLVSFIIVTIIIGYLVARYGRPAIQGIVRRKMKTPGLVSFNADKYYELEGLGAFLMGLVLLMFCLFLVVFWINSAYAFFF